jgi:sec-independent protein translocase protein TatB
MFNIGGGEFLVIALIALIVLGPQRLPDAARQVGKAMGELRRLSAGFQNELKDAFSDAEATGPTTPRRDVLAGPPPAVDTANGTTAPARSSSPTRRVPLQAAPVDAAAEPAADTPAAPPARAAQRAPRPKPAAAPGGVGSSAPTPKASRPRSRG